MSGGRDRREVYLDVAPMFEKEWTGIPIVTAQLARHALADRRRRWLFLYNNQLLPKDAVEDVFRARSGRWLEPGLMTLLNGCPLPGFERMRESIALFPNVKACRNLFWHEAMIIHDLSTVLTPRYHHPDTIAHHANRLWGDIASSQTLICVSGATADDVRTYFRVPGHRIVVAPLGVDWPFPTRVEAAALLDQADLSPFVLVLGTVEPRKNIGLVIEFIKQRPDVLDEHTFVFVGREGWLGERQKLAAWLRDLGVAEDRVVFTGFVSDAMKLALLCRAAFTIYPSMFEGFGLPVLESVSVGCPVLCSLSSSLPEVADESCLLFDPTDLGQFAAVYDEMVRSVRARPRPPIDPLTFEVRDDWRWARFLDRIDRWLEGLDARPSPEGIR